MIFKNVLTSSLFIFSTVAVAADLKAPIGLPSAKVLPKGVRNLSYKAVLAEATDKYNSSGANVKLADPFFKKITYGDVIQGKKNLVDRAGVIQVMDSVGAKESDELASSTGQANIKATAHVPVLAYGVNTKLTLAVAVPVLQYSTNVDTGVNHNNPDNYYSFLKALEKKGAGLKQEEFLNKMKRPVPSKLEDYGYKPLENESGSVLGDIKLVAKQLVFDDHVRNLVTVSAEVTLPTGKKADINKAINVPGGDGQYDVGFGVAHDVSFLNYFTVSSLASYTVQIKDKEELRVPERVDSKATPDIDQNVRRDLGDSALLQSGLKMNYHGLNVAAGYSFQYKEKDRYEGDLYESYRYSWIGEETRQRMEVAQFVVGYDTLELFKQGKFKAPLSVMANYSLPTRGKNVVNDPTLTLDFNLFF